MGGGVVVDEPGDRIDCFLDFWRRADREGIGILGGEQPEAGGAEGGAEIAVSGDGDRQVEDGRDDRQPSARARAAADGDQASRLGERHGQHVEAILKGEGDALEHGLNEILSSVALIEAGEDAADRNVVVRRALAGEIGKE